VTAPAGPAQRPSIAMIAARSRNGVIGRAGTIPWHARGEQRLFREITLGNTLIMGRATWESIGHPLPGRDIVVLSRRADYDAGGCRVARDLPQALALARSLSGTPFVAGGGEVYREALPDTDVLHLTTVDVWVEGDVHFPPFDPSEFVVEIDTLYESNLNYRYQKLVRKR
jgi:dihydrofolate reductase